MKWKAKVINDRRKLSKTIKYKRMASKDNLK